MEYFETAAYAHARLRDAAVETPVHGTVETAHCLLELSGRLERRSQIEEKANWAQVANLRRLDELLEQALEFFKD